MTQHRVDSVRIKKGGKGPTVMLKMPDGSLEKVCILWHSVELSKSCIAQVRGDRLQEVIDNHGHYAPGNYQKYLEQGNVCSQCSYCYGKGYNTGQVLPRVVDEETKKDFEELTPDAIRGGKLTELGHPYYHAPLMDLVRMAKEFNSTLILPNKMLPFGIEGALETAKTSNYDTVARLAQNLIRYGKGGVEEKVKMSSGEEMAELFGQAPQVILHYSLGYEREDIERGAITQGFTNPWRIRQAVKFFQAGASSNLTLVADPAQSIRENIKRGSALGMALKAREKCGIPMRLIALRTGERFVARELLCRDWEEIKEGLEQERIVGENLLTGEAISRKIRVPEENPPYIKKEKSKNTFIASGLHPDFQELVNEGVTICGAIGHTEYCDFCSAPESVHPNITRGINSGLCQETASHDRKMISFDIAHLGIDPEYQESFRERARKRKISKARKKQNLDESLFELKPDGSLEPIER